MSMLSSKCDKLRKAAQNARDFGSYELEQLLLDAADTIIELRDDLQDANAENAKLRDDLFLAQHIIGQIAHEGFELIDDNKKLREQCARLYEFAMSEYPDGTELNFAHELRKLGVEVPE